MHATLRRQARTLSVIFALGLILAPLWTGGPTALAEESGGRVFRSDFDELSLGLLPLNTPFPVELGSVVATAATVAVVESVDDKRALGVSGAGIASLRFSTYPGAAPRLTSDEGELRVEADLVAPPGAAGSATLALATAGGQSLPVLAFAAGGQLRHGDSLLGISYTPGQIVALEARYDLGERTLELRVRTGGDEVRLRGLAVAAGYPLAESAQLLFTADDPSGSYTIDRAEVRLDGASGGGGGDDEQEREREEREREEREREEREREEREREERRPDPARLSLPAGTAEVELGDNAAIVALKIALESSRGPAKDVRLTLNFDDSRLALADLGFGEGVGYVIEQGEGRVVIGIGPNNAIRKGRFELRIRLRVRSGGEAEQRLELRYRVRYRDRDGAHETPAVTLPVVVPPFTAAPPPAPTIVRLPAERVDLRFRVSWERGGLPLYGLPLSEPITTSAGIVVQYFERARFEYHPANAGAPALILLGRLGAELGGARPPVAPPSSATELAWYFPATGHLIAAPFRAAWTEAGGLQQFGYPLGPAYSDERGLQVQYFERARLELHPSADGRDSLVLLGLLGEELLLRERR